MPTRQARGGSSAGTRRGYPRRSPNPNRVAIVGSASDRRTPGGNGKFEHIPSISRSSGVDPDGDMYVYVVPFLERFFLDTDRLKDHRVQEEYRLFLQQKVIGFMAC